MKRLVSLLSHFADETGEPLTVVFDGRAFDLSAESVQVEFAGSRGRDAADRHIAAKVEADPDPRSITVVTSDRELAGRARRAGTQVLGSGPFRTRLDRVSRPDA